MMLEKIKEVLDREGIACAGKAFYLGEYKDLYKENASRIEGYLDMLEMSLEYPVAISYRTESGELIFADGPIRASDYMSLEGLMQEMGLEGFYFTVYKAYKYNTIGEDIVKEFGGFFYKGLARIEWPLSQGYPYEMDLDIVENDLFLLQVWKDIDYKTFDSYDIKSLEELYSVLNKYLKVSK
jgi:hypothetical protein